MSVERFYPFGAGFRVKLGGHTQEFIIAAAKGNAAVMEAELAKEPEPFIDVQVLFVGFNTREEAESFSKRLFAAHEETWVVPLKDYVDAVREAGEPVMSMPGKLFPIRLRMGLEGPLSIGPQQRERGEIVPGTRQISPNPTDDEIEKLLEGIPSLAIEAAIDLLGRLLIPD